MPFVPGDIVWIERLGREGTVREVQRSGGYRVEVGPLLVACKESELRSPTGKGRRGKSTSKPLSAYYTHLKGDKKNSKKGAGKEKSKGGSRSLSVDLHGMTVEQAIGAVERTLNRAVLEDYDQLEVIHGRGTGKLKTAVTAYLRGLSVVSHVQQDTVNPGVTWAYL